MSCIWIPCAALGDEIIWPAKNKQVLLYCFYNDALLNSSVNISAYNSHWVERLYFTKIPLWRKAPDNQWILIKLTTAMLGPLQMRCSLSAGCCSVIHDNLESHSSPIRQSSSPNLWVSPIINIDVDTDSTSHGSRQFVLWVDWIWTPCPHLTPSNYTWQMLGACTRTLILCGKESNFHIWHWAPPPPLPFVLWVSVTRCGPTTNLIKMQRCDCVFACVSVCVCVIDLVTLLECVKTPYWYSKHILNYMSVCSCTCLVCVTRTCTDPVDGVHWNTLLAGSMCQWLIPPSLKGDHPPPLPSSCHPLITTSTDGSFYFPTEY